MPYIDQQRRRELEQSQEPETVGELNYLISRMCSKYLYLHGCSARYEDFNAVIGVLECAKLELFRAKVGPYEEEKRLATGNVYP